MLKKHTFGKNHPIWNNNLKTNIIYHTFFDYNLQQPTQKLDKLFLENYKNKYDNINTVIPSLMTDPYGLV